VLDSVDKLIWAVGREPLTAELNLPTAGIDTLPSGHIKVDVYQNTTRKGIYAVGDVSAPHWELTPGF
jgi:glutathione reductase (NADPH)